LEWGDADDHGRRRQLAAGFDSALLLLASAVIALTLLAIANSWQLTLVGAEPGAHI
jgi:hypothetical protein